MIVPSFSMLHGHRAPPGPAVYEFFQETFGVLPCVALKGLGQLIAEEVDAYPDPTAIDLASLTFAGPSQTQAWRRFRPLLCGRGPGRRADVGQRAAGSRRQDRVACLQLPPGRRRLPRREGAVHPGRGLLPDRDALPGVREATLTTTTSWTSTPSRRSRRRRSPVLQVLRRPDATPEVGQHRNIIISAQLRLRHGDHHRGPSGRGTTQDEEAGPPSSMVCRCSQFGTSASAPPRALRERDTCRQA